jgi:hypothetical protein
MEKLRLIQIGKTVKIELREKAKQDSRSLFQNQMKKKSLKIF